MHSAIIALLATSTGFVAAKPLTYPKRVNCPSLTEKSAYYVCGNNGFRGYCSVDPCAKPWCPDFNPETCDRLIPSPGTNTTTVCSGMTTTPTTVCSSTPSSTTCSGTTSTSTATCPGTTSTSSTSCSDKPSSTVCSCSGTTTSTSCSKKPSSTVSSSTTSTTAPACSATTSPTVCPGSAPFYVCANNGFRGSCSVDPCAIDWCPDFEPKTCKKAPTVETRDPKPQCNGSGAFYVCANNGFRGNCSVDPCALAWCPDYQSKTCQGAVLGTPEKTKPETGKNKTDDNKPQTGNNGVCPEGTGYYQVCGNGYRGCCKADACGQASPICPKSQW